MTTAIDLITRALRRAGVLGEGETPSAEATADSLYVLNELLGMWSLESLMVYRRVEVVHTLTGAMSYMVGPGAEIDTDRPIRLYGAFTRNGDSDTYMDVVDDQFFASIPYKISSATSYFIRYDAQMPVGRIDLWPQPGPGIELHLMCDMQFSPVEHSADEMVLPPGYERALRLALAVDLCGEFDRALPAELIGLAADAKANVKRANAPLTVAQFDAALGVGRRSKEADFMGGR